MTKKGKSFLAVTVALVLLGAFMVSFASAHTIDYIATDIQPQAIFSGQSGHFKLVDPIAPGGTITFNLTLELILSQGGATSALPATAVFGVKNTGGGYDPSLVKFGTPNTTLSDTVSHTYDKTSSQVASFMTPVTAYAPTEPGSYHFKIQAISGFQGKGFTPGDGIVIHFNVAEPEKPIETVLTVTLGNSNILYHAPANTLFATLTEKQSGNPVEGESIDFYFNGAKVASATTDANGVAAYDYNTSGLEVGDHTVAANYQGVAPYVSSSGSATQCVTYKWLGFQPPVLVQSSTTSGLGIGLFQGKVIPVKIKVADYYGAAVTNAEARVYFAQTVTGAAEVQAVAIQPTIADSGNLMRYDAVADQYILNWNISGLPNGDYNVRVGTTEGECAVGHWNPVRIGKASK
ncbi:MAG: hypothetical protein A4E65_02359 [Syntrophorhabdus sp. PtaU1.Bin153]|nr:MAG: hypothetical protein A4E65_02359 [Syntrophorhabdus sp. PtaU1.Bin153]